MKIQSAKAGIGTGRAGLQAASGLFSNAGLFQKGVKSFHPNDLDPYLLFDAESSMIGTLENPTLDLDPSKQDTLDVITATRAGTATYTDFNGNIASAPANTVRVDQTQGAELTPTKFQHIGYTDFSSGRVLSNFGTGVTPVLSSDALGSPNGTEDAYKIVFNSGSGTTSGDGSELYFNASEIEDNIQSTASIYLRGENGGEQLIFRGASNGSYQLVTLTTEWQKFTTTESTSPSGNQKFTFGIRQSVSGHGVINSAATIYAYGPQLEEGTTASSFVANTTGNPKFITGATFGPRVPMILVEPSATNLVTNSSFGGWVAQSNTTISSNTTETLSPDGTNNATKMTSNGSEGLYIASLGTASLNTKSIFLKGVSGGEQVVLQDPHQNIDPLTCTLTTEWQRFHLTQTQTGSFGLWLTNIPASGIYAFGAQVETGSLTSYIPTSGSTAQRAADDLVISGSAFSGFFNGSEGTTYMEAVPNSSSNAPTFFEYFDASDASNQIMGSYISGSTISYYVKTNGSFVAIHSIGNVNLNQLNRIAVSYKTNDILGSLNGAAEVADTSAALPTGIDKLAIGNDNSGNFSITGRIRRLIYWPTHSDNL